MAKFSYAQLDILTGTLLHDGDVEYLITPARRDAAGLVKRQFLKKYHLYSSYTLTEKGQKARKDILMNESLKLAAIRSVNEFLRGFADSRAGLEKLYDSPPMEVMLLAEEQSKDPEEILDEILK